MDKMTERFGPSMKAIPMEQDQTHAPPTALTRTTENPSPASRSPGPGGMVASAKPAQAATAPRARSPRRFILPLILLAGVGYGAHMAYDWFVEGRFLVSTDDAYVGADTAIIAAKVSGHVTEVAVAQNQAVHVGDLLVRIDDGDYKLMVEAAKAKVDTQDATIVRIGRQVEAQKAVIAQAEAQIGSARAQRESENGARRRQRVVREPVDEIAQRRGKARFALQG